MKLKKFEERTEEFQERMEKFQERTERDMARLRRVLLSVIQIGVRDRSKINDLLNALTGSQLQLESKFERFLDSQNPN